MFGFKTRDRKTKDNMRFYTIEKVGIKRSLTPEGFLLCEDVPLARTGVLIYGPGETPITTVGPDGLVRIRREEDEVFRDEAIASFSGKPFTDEHPDEDVDPRNWKQLTKGIVLNPRRGLGLENELMLGDILVTDKATIDKIMNDDKVEVSCGYDADYEEVGPGEGRQSNIVGNHVALVNRGRCGPRCAIGDAAPTNLELHKMSKKSTKDSKAAFMTFLHRAFKAKDSSELEEIAEEARDEIAELTEPAQAIHVHIDSNPGLPGASQDEEIDPETRTFDDEAMAEFVATNASEHEAMSARIAALEEAVASMSGGNTPAADDDCDLEVMDEAEATEAMLDEAEEGFEEADVTKARDSAFLKSAYDATIAAAEILLPGVRVPDFDAKANPKKTVDGLKAFRAKVIDMAASQTETHDIIRDLTGGKPINAKRMKARDVKSIFQSAASTKRAMNNVGLRSKAADTQNQVKPGAVQSLADLNAANRARKW